MAGRGRAAAFLDNISRMRGRGEAPAAVDEDDKKPRGRGAIFRRPTPVPSSSTADSNTDVSVATTTSSGAAATASSSVPTTSSSSGILSQAGSSTGSGSGQYDSATFVSSISSDSKESIPKKAIGRAALFGQKTPTPRTISEDLKSKLSLEESAVARDKSDSGFTSALEELPSDGRSTVSERPLPVVRLGQSGQSVSATANYIRLDFVDRDRGIYEYEAMFEPQVDAKRERFHLVATMWRQFGGNIRMFDGGWRIFSPEKLANDMNVGSSQLRSGTEIKVKIVFKRVKKFDDCRFVLNIIFKRLMAELKLVRFGRSDYNPKAVHTIPEYKLKIWPGCITAIDEFEGGIALYCDASHRVLRDETCLSIIFDIRTMCMQSGRVNFKDELEKTFMGLSVICNYNKKILRVDDIDFEASPKSTFKKKDEDISFVDYYKTQYNIEIKDLNQPMLVHRAKKKEMGKEKEDQLVYLIPELCSPTGLTDEMRNNFQLMKKVAEFTRVGPQERQNALRDFIRSIKENEKARQILAEWNLKLPDTTINLIGRVLPPEEIIFGKNRTVRDANADWGRAASNNEMLSAVDLENWYILFSSRDDKVAENFTCVYKRLASKLGVRVSTPTPIRLTNDKASEYCSQIKKIIQQDDKVRFFVIVFPSNRDDRYSAVKKLLNSDLGIASQVIISRTISNQKNLNSVVTKIALQINCKIGGALWGINIPYSKDGIMFCGIDAYHEGTRSTRSVVGLVTSTNTTCTRWFSSTQPHNRGQEISDVLQGMFRHSLETWYKMNNAFPARIVIFRDGVGDGQLPVVRDHEVPQFYELFDRIKDGYKPMFTYVIVQKRINTRLYMIERDRFVNPKPGFVMDHTITRRDWYDFFLVSQNVRQGTVAPTHFVVVHDGSDMKTDHIQRLTYKMTHLYYNWNGTVRVPAPCQYAHKLAYLVGQHMKSPANEKLQNLLYFL